MIPLTSRACAALSLWLSRFPDAGPDSYVFPAHKIGFVGNSRRSDLNGIDMKRPIGEWKKAWTDALRTAGLKYRWHDLRHSFVSRLASSPVVSETILKALSGHVSKRMLEHYSHVHASAKQVAIELLESHNFDTASPQKSPQSTNHTQDGGLTISHKSLN
jgi:integrase